MVVLNVVMITLGQVLAYGVGAGFERVPGGWRWMVGLGCVPAGMQALALGVLPESRELVWCFFGVVFESFFFFFFFLLCGLDWIGLDW
jgi:hypothetical protein